MSEYGISLDLLAALFTLLYIAKLLFQANSESGAFLRGHHLEKRSLLNQQGARRSAQAGGL